MCNSQTVTRSVQLATCNSQLATRNSQLATRNLQLAFYLVPFNCCQDCFLYKALCKTIFYSDPTRVCCQRSCIMKKPAFCICQNKDPDQLRGNSAAEHHLCLCYINSTSPLPPKSKVSSLLPHSVVVHPSLCQTWSETPKTGFLMTLLKGRINYN